MMYENICHLWEELFQLLVKKYTLKLIAQSKKQYNLTARFARDTEDAEGG